MRPYTTPDGSGHDSLNYKEKLKNLQDKLGKIRIPLSIRKGIKTSSLRVTKDDSMYKRLVMDVDELYSKVKVKPAVSSIEDFERVPTSSISKSPKDRRIESPAMNRFRTQRVKTKLGPGSYYTESAVSGPAYGFTVIPRMIDLVESLEHYSPVNKVQTKADIEAIKQRIESNMDLSIYRPEAKSVIIQERAKKAEERLKFTHKSRCDLESRMREKRSQSMMAKQRRYEWRSRIPEVKRIAVNWQAILVVLGTTRHMKNLMIVRIASKARAEQLLRHFFIVVRAIGKYKIMLSRVRVNRAMRTMRRMIGPCTLWIRRRKVLLAIKIASSVEYALTNDMMFKMMGAWRIKILLIQRNFVRYLAVKKARLQVLQIKWRKIEKGVRKKKLKAKKKHSSIEHVSTPVMQAYTALYYKECVNLYVKNIEEHAIVCADVDAANNERAYELSINLVGTTPLLKPRAPTLRLFTQQKLFESFIIKSRAKP